ncbi:MAG: phosphoribosylglycinamide formyltransferase [Myxococcales bacterium FL481]|nr:MAG: phosphoribosylglycinamide formyltransferase [Myxococcales bacterium FL481]
MPPRLRLGLLASGGGSNVQALIAAVGRGDLEATIAVVIANNSGCGALQHARNADLVARHISSKTHADEDAALRAELAAHRVDVVVLAGYMKRIGPQVLSAYPGRIVNIHPGPLPRFGGRGMFGRRVHEAVLAGGVASSGPTVHLVDEEYDHGSHLAHRPVPVMADDTPETLAQRVLVAEHDLYWRVIADHFVGRLSR